MTFSVSDFLPYGGVLSGSFSGTLLDGYLLYNVGDDIGTVTSSDAKFSGNFPGNPNVSFDLGPAVSLEYQSQSFIFNFGFGTLGYPSDLYCFADTLPLTCTGYISAFGTSQYSTQPPGVSISFAPESGTFMLVGLGTLTLLHLATRHGFTNS